MHLIKKSNLYFYEKELAYTGQELRSHFLLEKFHLRGNAVAAFMGRAQVSTSNLVDLEDQMNTDVIEAKQMLHLMGEFFGLSLREAVFLQRMMIVILGEVLQLQLDQNKSSFRVTRDGDDLFIGNQKLSVSIATSSAVSSVIHIGVNLDPAGAPVSAIGLNDLGIEPKVFLNAFYEKFFLEIEGVDWACVKVRPVI